jgi:hypothetical protein
LRTSLRFVDRPRPSLGSGGGFHGGVRQRWLILRDVGRALCGGKLKELHPVNSETIEMRPLVMEPVRQQSECIPLRGGVWTRTDFFFLRSLGPLYVA